MSDAKRQRASGHHENRTPFVTEFIRLDVHDQQIEMARAMTNEHAYDGFFAKLERAAGSNAVGRIVDRLDGAQVPATEIAPVLEPFEA